MMAIGGGTETVTSLAKTDHGDGLRLHIKVNSLSFFGKIVFKKAISTTIKQVLYCLAVVSLALHVLTIVYAVYGIPELAYNRQSEQAFGIPEQILVDEKERGEERVLDESWWKNDKELRREEGRERREVKQGGRGDVEFVHPDLKKELLKQGEDPANPWVWLTSYSRIPVNQFLFPVSLVNLSSFLFLWSTFQVFIGTPLILSNCCTNKPDWLHHQENVQILALSLSINLIQKSFSTSKLKIPLLAK